MTNAGPSRTRILVLVAIVALFAALGIRLAQQHNRAGDDVVAAEAISAESRSESTTLDLPAESSSSRAVGIEPAQIPSIEVAAPTKATGARVEGRVLDILGNPIASAPVLAETRDYLIAPKLALSGPDGSFQFASERDDLRLIASSANWRTLRSQLWRADQPRTGVIVVAPCVTLSGEVVDQAGVVLPRARITVETSRTILAQFPFDLDATGVPQQWSQGVDHGGRFTLDGAIRTPGTTLKVECEEYLPRTLPMPSDPNAFLRVELVSDPNCLKRTIRGIVVRRNGEPATQAIVRFGNQHAATDAQGAFELPCTVKVEQRLFTWDDWSDDSPLIATEAGSQAAIRREFGRVVKASPQDPPPEKLFLGPPPLSIRGRVLDGRRQPLAGYTVTLVDPTRVSWGLSPPTSAEQLTGGEAKTVKTDAQGVFELGGLFDRHYRVQAFSSKTFGRLESADIPAGSHDVELVFAADAFLPEITGRIVGRDGVGIGGAKIVLVVMSARTVNQDGSQGGEASGGRDKATTADDGSFRLESIPRHGSELRVRGTDLIERSLLLKDLDIERPLVIQVDHARKFRIENLPATENRLTGIEVLSSTKDKLHLLALDAQQNELRVSRSANSQYGSTNRLELGDDPAEIYTVSEAAFEFVLYASDGTVLGRRPAHLVRNGVSMLKW